MYDHQIYLASADMYVGEGGCRKCLIGIFDDLKKARTAVIETGRDLDCMTYPTDYEYKDMANDMIKNPLNYILCIDKNARRSVHYDGSDAYTTLILCDYDTNDENM